MVVPLTDDIYWVGVVDWALKHFHGHELSTHRGSSYNAYLILDEKKVLVDAVWTPFEQDFMAQVRELIDPAELDYVVANHSEVDHAGALPALMREATNAELLVSEKGLESFPGNYHADWNMRAVKNGETLNIGKRELVFIRRFDFGIFNLLKKIMQALGVEMDVALNIIVDGSFDVSQAVKEVSDPFVKQLVISRHFVERRENCRVAGMYVPDGDWVPRDWLGEIKTAMGFDLHFWDPFQSGGLNVQPNALAPGLENQKSRFAAAVGVALGAFEEE